MKRAYIAAITGTVVAGIIIGFVLFHKQTTTKTEKKQTSASTIKGEDTIHTPILDYETLLIDKLKKAVKEGSNGLYNLSLQGLKVNLPNSTVSVTGAQLSPDTAVFHQLEVLKKAPDDVFKVTLRFLQLNHINVKDILLNKTINLAALSINKPVVEVYHKTRAYNKKKTEDSLTLYKRLTGDWKSIGIGNIVISHCTYINHNLDEAPKTTHFNDVSMHFKDLLIDSATQNDKRRFLFTKDALLTFRNYILKTADSLYLFKMGAVTVSANQHTITATDIVLQPRFSKEEFSRKVKESTTRYEIAIPKITFTNMDWWKLTNRQELSADRIDMYNAIFKSYLDRTLPPSKPEYQNFPQQLLLKQAIPVAVKKIYVHNLNIDYQEYSPTSKQKGTIYFYAVNGSIDNITNQKEEIRRNSFSTTIASGKFMKRIPVQARFDLNLAQPKRGGFSAHLGMAGFDATTLNNVAEPMGIFNVKRGVIKNVTAEMKGDDSTANGTITILYNNLHITPLKKAADGGMKKKSLISFIANTFVLKNDNPGKNGEPRSPQFTVQRNPTGSFFSFIWKVVLTGALETAGAPKKLAD